MNNEYFLPVVMQIIGTFVVFAEVILPSGGILTLISLGLFGYSIYYVFSVISSAAGMGFIVADLMIVPLAVVTGFKYLSKSSATLSSSLSSKDGVTSQSKDYEALVGKEGVVLSDLRPSGKALIEDKRFDVVSRGDFISQSSKIVVQKVTGNQIIVKKL